MKFILVKRSKALKFIFLTLAFAVMVTALLITGAAGVYSGKTTRKLPIYSVETPEKVVALSFDASWGADKTLDILKVLKNYDVKANFFCVGFWAEKYPEILKELHDSGYLEIGTHSNTHEHMAKLTARQIELDLSTSVNIIEKITGVKPSLFRAPFGEYNDTLLSVAAAQNLQTIQWDVDSLDWKELSALDMSSRILNGVKPGSIVLMHNDGKNTVAALPIIIEGLKNKGYSFTTIGNLTYKENFTIDHTGRQIKN